MFVSLRNLLFRFETIKIFKLKTFVDPGHSREGLRYKIGRFNMENNYDLARLSKTSILILDMIIEEMQKFRLEIFDLLCGKNKN